MRNVLGFSMALWLLSCPAVFSQSLHQVGSQDLGPLVHNTSFLIWFFGSLVAAWLFNVVFGMATLRSFYPPNAARFGLWLSMLLWCLFVSFVLFGHIVTAALPLWFEIVLLFMFLIFAVVMLSQRRRID